MMRLCAAEDGGDTRQARFHACTHVQRCDRPLDRVDANHRSYPCSQVAHSVAADAAQRTVTMATSRQISMTISGAPAAVLPRFNCRCTSSAYLIGVG